MTLDFENFEMPAMISKNMAVAQKNTHCVLDLETFSNTPNSVIVSIGAVCFSNDTPDHEMGAFYIRVDPQDCVSYGLEINAATVQWWLKQNDKARLEVAKEDGYPLIDAIEEFSDWYAANGCTSLWGNGAGFDNVIIDNAVKKLNDQGHNVKPSWSYRHHQCFRTMRKQFPGHQDKESRGLIAHNAMSDALVQALELQKILRSLKCHQGN